MKSLSSVLEESSYLYAQWFYKLVPHVRIQFRFSFTALMSFIGMEQVQRLIPSIYCHQLKQFSWNGISFGEIFQFEYNERYV